jgi:hypothetical protein
MSSDPLALENVLNMVKMTLNDPYQYLDQCDGCNDKMWVRLVDDGDSQYCVRCDPND